jgi:hypothetical protein
MNSSFEIAEQARHLANDLMDLTDTQTGEVNEAVYDAWLEDVEKMSATIGEKLQRLEAVETRMLSEAEENKDQSILLAGLSKRRLADAKRMRQYMKMLLLAHRDMRGADRVDMDNGRWARLTERTTYEVEVEDLGRIHSVHLVHAPPRLDRASIIATYKEKPTSETLKGIRIQKVTTEHVMKGGK